MYYVQRGSVPQQRHTQHRAPDGSLYAEELFGVEGFTGRSRHLPGRIGSSRSGRSGSKPRTTDSTAIG
jgi:homogentisate 1,2-dioxygenase